MATLQQPEKGSIANEKRPHANATSHAQSDAINLQTIPTDLFRSIWLAQLLMTVSCALYASVIAIHGITVFSSSYPSISLLARCVYAASTGWAWIPASFNALYLIKSRWYVRTNPSLFRQLPSGALAPSGKYVSSIRSVSCLAGILHALTGCFGLAFWIMRRKQPDLSAEVVSSLLLFWTNNMAYAGILLGLAYAASSLLEMVIALERKGITTPLSS